MLARIERSAPLTLRFGPDLGHRLDQATGRTSEVVIPVRSPDLIEARRAFAEPIGAAETIARYIGRLVVQLCEALEIKALVPISAFPIWTRPATARQALSSSWIGRNDRGVDWSFGRSRGLSL